MGVKEILGYIYLAGGVILFVTMYLIPRLNRRKISTSQRDTKVLKEARGKENDTTT